MQTFKEQMAQDLDQVFINQNEFADWYILNKHKIKCIVESNQVEPGKYNRSDSFNDGISQCDVIVFYKFVDYPVVLDTYSDCYFDSVKYHVHNYKCDDGLVKLELTRV